MIALCSFSPTACRGLTLTASPATTDTNKTRTDHLHPEPQAPQPWDAGFQSFYTLQGGAGHCSSGICEHWGSQLIGGSFIRKKNCTRLPGRLLSPWLSGIFKVTKLPPAQSLSPGLLTIPEGKQVLEKGFPPPPPTGGPAYSDMCVEPQETRACTHHF